MKNGSMFGTLKAFADANYFAAHTRGVVYLPGETRMLEFLVDHVDREIYSTECGENHLAYVKRNARQHRDIEVTEEDKIVTLLTCSYEFKNARMMLLAKVSDSPEYQDTLFINMQ